MSENMPILYRNIMDGLPSDFARDVFLWAVERPGEDRMCYRAEAFAREVGDYMSTVHLFASMAARIHGLDRVDPDLTGFIAERWANWRYGGNVKLPPHLRSLDFA